VMLAFGFGAAIPLLVLGSLSRAAMLRWRGRMLQVGRGGKLLVGAVSLAVALLIVTGLDRRLEVALVDASPGWLTALTTRF
jgi:cytochrome c-type biogenesis protein